jgi:hypothetical protein
MERVPRPLAVIVKLIRDGRAQDMVEYSLMAGFVSIMASALWPPLIRPLRHIADRVAKVLPAAGGVAASC